MSPASSFWNIDPIKAFHSSEIVNESCYLPQKRAPAATGLWEKREMRKKGRSSSIRRCVMLWPLPHKKPGRDGQVNGLPVYLAARVIFGTAHSWVLHLRAGRGKEGVAKIYLPGSPASPGSLLSIVSLRKLNSSVWWHSALSVVTQKDPLPVV